VVADRLKGMGRGSVVVVAASAAVFSACGSSSPPPVAAPATAWVALPSSPLSPRASAVGVWTGAEVLVVGGEPEAWCPPIADCAAPEFSALADGAAFDPASRSWRRIADAPMTFAGNASAVAAGGDVYVLVRDARYRPGGAGRGFLRYRPDVDRWDQLPTPPRALGWYQLATAGETVVVYAGSVEARPLPDFEFDPQTDEWRKLPRDPLAPSFDRTIVGVGDDLFLFAHDLVANPGSERPSLTRVARFDPATGQWERRADSEILGSAPWFVEDGVLVNPTLGAADGGDTNNWGRSYPNGGVYDSTTDSWRDLPNRPADADVGGEGVIGRAHALFTDADGLVLDWATGEWITIPRLPGATDDYETNPFNRTVVTAGTDLYVFGGEVWPTRESGSVLDAGYVWHSRTAGAGSIPSSSG
jgi:hypothetical protein